MPSASVYEMSLFLCLTGQTRRAVGGTAEDEDSDGGLDRPGPTGLNNNSTGTGR